MTCPVCGGDTTVIGSRADCEGVYRRRKCRECDYKFHTTELESDGEDFERLQKEAEAASKCRREEASR